MNELVLFSGNALPTLIDAAGDQARMRFVEFFTADIRNPNTRRAYAKACEEFLAWCSFAGVPWIAEVQPVHVATYIEQLAQDHSTPTVKARLAAIRRLFDWLVAGPVARVNPAASVRGPSHVVKKARHQSCHRTKHDACLRASTPVLTSVCAIAR
jgi:site-specific recombinase XerD